MATHGRRKPKMKRNFFGDFPSFFRIVQEKVALSRPRVPHTWRGHYLVGWIYHAKRNYTFERFERSLPQSVEVRSCRSWRPRRGWPWGVCSLCCRSGGSSRGTWSAHTWRGHILLGSMGEGGDNTFTYQMALNFSTHLFTVMATMFIRLAATLP